MRKNIDVLKNAWMFKFQLADGETSVVVCRHGNYNPYEAFVYIHQKCEYPLCQNRTLDEIIKCIFEKQKEASASLDARPNTKHYSKWTIFS